MRENWNPTSLVETLRKAAYGLEETHTILVALSALARAEIGSAALLQAGMMAQDRAIQFFELKGEKPCPTK